MHYLICKHKVADFAKWRQVFDSHAEAQRESGLRLLHLLRDADDADMIVMWFRVDDLEKAKAFVSAPAAGEAADTSGVVGKPEILFLHD